VIPYTTEPGNSRSSNTKLYTNYFILFKKKMDPRNAFFILLFFWQYWGLNSELTLARQALYQCKKCILEIQLFLNKRQHNVKTGK
jgi:hypothetical protein